jgi:general stress protein 26
MSNEPFYHKNVAEFAEIEQEFSGRGQKAVWCVAASIEPQGRPRTRILHPIWQGSIGWISTHRHSTKAKHLAHSPYLSLAYAADPMKPVYVDCTAEFIDDLVVKKWLWDLALSTPEPVGYDPALDFISYDNPTHGVLKLTPWRIEVYTLSVGTKIWKAKQEVKA